MDELRLILEQAHEREFRQMKFFASLKGVDLEAGRETPDDRVQRVKDRVAARARGETTEKYELEEYFGTEYEVEE